MPQAKPTAEWSWKTRERAWVFGMGSEPLLGLPVAPITDGEGYELHGPFPAGVRIPAGESGRVRPQADKCTEFFECLEQTPEDIARVLTVQGPQARLPAAAFIVEQSRKKGRRTHHVRYAARTKVALVDVLALCNRLGPRTRLFVTTYAAKMKAFREGIENGPA